MVMSHPELERPLQTHRTYKVCSGGPVDIYYIPHDEEHDGNKFAFQIFYCWKPLLCATAKCFTRVICQSDVPIFVPETTSILVEGKDVSIYAPLSARVRLADDEDEKIQIRPRSTLVPEKGVVVIYAADMRKFDEIIQQALETVLFECCNNMYPSEDAWSVAQYCQWIYHFDRAISCLLTLLESSCSRFPEQFQR
ncbi:hypothetical protein V3C99_014741 [Haemonchus contortus]